MWQKQIDKIIKSPIPPKNTNVLWDNGDNLKIYRKGKLESANGGDNNYSKLETALKFSSITIIGDELQDYYGFAYKYRDMPFESFQEEELQVEYGNGVRDSITIREFLEDLNWYKSCRLLIPDRVGYTCLNLSYYYTGNNGHDLHNCSLIFGGGDTYRGVMISINADTGRLVEVNVTEV